MLSLSFKASLLATVMVLIIKATFWRPYWEILTSRYFEAKDGQYSNNCHTPLTNRFQVALWCLSSRKHFGTSTWNFLLKPLRPKIWPNCTNCDTPLSHRFSSVLWSLSSERYFGALTVLFLLTKLEPKDGQFSKYCYMPLNRRFRVVVWYLSSERHFRPLRVKGEIVS